MATFKRPSRKPLTFFSDKLARLDVHKTLQTTAYLGQTPLKVKMWYGKNMQDKDTMITALWVERPHALTRSSSLVNTDFGPICPNCNTNEFLKYRASEMTITQREQTRFNREDYGMSCTVCSACSPYKGGN